MKAPETPPIVVGRVSRVEICGDGSGVILWVGSVSLRLDVRAARDVAATLACALIGCTEAATTAGARAAIAAGVDDELLNQRDEWDVPTLPEPFGRKGTS